MRAHDEEPTEPANTPLNAKLIVDAFAARGVVCGVLRPSEDEPDEVRSIAPRAISRSDLVILDWHLHGDDGEATIKLLGDVIREAGEAMRLVAIYTGEPDLARVAKKLADRLGATRIDDVSLEVGPVRIVAIGKADEDASSEAGRASEGELPDILMKLFAGLADGLVRSAAFRRSLLCVAPPTDCLRASEARSTLATSGSVRSCSRARRPRTICSGCCSRSFGRWSRTMRPRGHAPTREAVALWLRRESEQGRAGQIPHEALAAAVEANLFDGETLNTLKQTHTELGPVKPKKGMTEYFASSPEVAKAADELFAMRMTLRLIYDRPDRVLSIGTIVREEATGEYLLCIQPACDSLRIKDEGRFPFVPLAIGGSSFDYVVRDAEETVYLRLSRKPSEIIHHIFEADAEALAVVARGEPPSFTTTSSEQFRWVAQLNEGHAQRAAHEIGVEQSRVGLAESDWLRRMSK